MADPQVKVLVVDDEPGMRALVRRCLADHFVIIEAENGTAALALGLDARLLGLLITDEMMPGVQGHELARQLRLQHPDLKVLYLTGYSDELFSAKKQMWDLEAYLDKPFSREALRQAAAQLVFGRLTL